MLGGDWTDGTMTDFKWRHFQGDVILWAVRWYCRYPISYRDLEEMLAERGISVDHTTIYRWVQCYAPEMEKRLRWFWRRGFDPSWRLDETYVKVRGKWTYLYRAVDKRGDTIDFYLSPTRGAKAAKRDLGTALGGPTHWTKPAHTNTDHTTIYRGVQCYAPEMEKRLRWFWRRGFDPSWRLDETYVKVRGKWTYLYRAVDKRGDTIDFYLSPTRGAKAAKRFLGKALRGLKHWEKPATLNTDKAPSYGAAITELKREGKLDRETAHRQVKYLNNVIEADHGKLKRLDRKSVV